MAYSLGSIVELTITTEDGLNATTASLVITLPDATTVSVTPTNPTTGSYLGTYTTTQSGRHPYQWVTTGTNAGVYDDVFDVYDSTSLALVSLTDLKRELNITTTTSDEELRDYLRRATSILEAHTGRAFARQTRTETFDVYRDERSVILTTPVISVTSVTEEESGSVIASTAYDVNKRAGILTLEGLSFVGGTASVEVVYVCGYTTPPPALAHAVLMQVRHMWETQRTTPGARRDDEWYPASGYMIPNRVLETIRPFMVSSIG